jgi:uncharacterized repeat protein (TIGR01451 family)
MNKIRTSNSSRPGKVSFVLIPILVLALVNVSNSVAAPPFPGGEDFATQDLPPEALPLPTDFVTHKQPPSNPKLDAAIASLVAAAEVSGEEAAVQAKSQLLRLSGGRVLVQVSTHARGVGNVVEAITRAGGEVTGVGNDDTLIQGWLPIEVLETVAAHDDVYLIRRPTQAVLLENLYVGNSTTEGLAVMNGPAWHTASHTGAGIKVGIIDAGFEDYTSLLGTDLPASVTVKNFVDGENDGDVDNDGDAQSEQHGLACAEIIHDIAPGASLYFAKILTDIDLAEAVAWLKDTHQVDIISTSLGFYNATPGDGTGVFANMVQDARNAGILWATAAGNDREVHWGGSYSPSTSDPDFHAFDGKNQQVNVLGPGDHASYYNIPAGYPIYAYLRWDDWTNVDQDYDLLLFYWNGSTWVNVAYSANDQNGGPGQRPTESIGVYAPATGAYAVAIARHSATRNVHFELFTPKMPGLDWREAARSVANLADAPDAMTVAALDVTSPYPQESYSSEGPTNGPGGAATGGFTKPDISGFANVATESYPAPPFNGTSAATPHVAGAAALVASAYPGYTAAQLQSFLEEHAIDMGSSGMDTLYGYGRLHLGDPPDLDLSIVKRIVGSPNLAPGDLVTFTLAVENSGSLTATGVVVSDTISTDILTPTWTASSSLTGIAVRGGTTYVWDLPYLAAGTSGVITVCGTISDTLSTDYAIWNTASISTNDAESDTTNNSSSVLVGGYRNYMPLVLRNS